MKGNTTITLNGDSITEALNRYLNSHLVQAVHVLGWSVDSAYGQPNVIVKFTESEPAAEQGIDWGLNVSGSALAANYTAEQGGDNRLKSANQTYHAVY